MEKEIQFSFSVDPLDPEQDELDDNDFPPFEGHEGGERVLKVRLDKWLWAARFFKTRALARAAVENGKVFYNGQRSKPSREIEIEAVLQIRHGRFEKTVIVKGLSTRRRSTEEAFQLFEETEESKKNREQAEEWYPKRSSDQSTYQPFDPQQQQPRERRTVRFLRRSFNRGNEQQPRYNDSPNTPYSTPKQPAPWEFET